jgi:hypothetical protein
MVIDEIHELLAMPRPPDADGYLERLDATLTAGYAHALQLEAERYRVERRLGEVAARLADEETGPRVDELASLARRLTAANESLAALRGLLASLRERRSAARAAA